MALYKIIKGIKYTQYSFLGLKFSTFSKNYKTETNLLSGVDRAKLLSNGLSLRAFFSETSGESQVAKDFVSLLKYGDIPFDKNEFYQLKEIPKFQNMINFTTSDYIKNRVYKNTSVLFWEFESGMLESRPYLFENTDRVFVFSDFCYNYINGLKPSSLELVKLRYPFNFNIVPDESELETRKKYGFTEEDFIVFFNFSYFSSYFRKNPEDLLEVFKNSLAGSKNAKLLIKTSNSECSRYHKVFLSKIREIGIGDNVTLINDRLSRQALINLMNMCNVYISLHRGEGLGLGMLEAMSLEKTVIATNYGGNTDFVKEGVAFPVDYKLTVPQQVDLKEYKYVKQWASPDKEQASEFLKRLYTDRELCVAVGKKAKSYVREMYSYKNVLKNFKENISELCE